MKERFVQTIYCDDIRHEVGGKLSYIGVYPSGVLFVPNFPVTLPKLCLFVKIVSPGEKPLQSLSVRVLKDDDILQEIIVNKNDLIAASVPPEEANNNINRVQTSQFILVFSPIHFDAPSLLKVRVQTETEELKGTGLKIEQLPNPNSHIDT